MSVHSKGNRLSSLIQEKKYVDDFGLGRNGPSKKMGSFVMNIIT